MTFRKGQSGNPGGKAPGTPNKKTLVCKALDAAAEDVTKAVIEAAKAGDVQAARLVLERIKPPLRPKAEPVTFPLDPEAPLTTQASQVLAAISTGDVDPDTGKLLIDLLSSFAGLRQSDELVARIAAIEARQNETATAHPGGVDRSGAVEQR